MRANKNVKLLHKRNGIKNMKTATAAAAKRQQSNKLLQSWIMVYFVNMIIIEFMCANKTFVKSNEKYESEKNACRNW